MKHSAIIWQTVFIVIYILFAGSCQGLFEASDDSEPLLTKPIATSQDGSITLSCNTDENYRWINIFRREVPADGSDAGEFINIGQMIPKSDTPQNSYQFSDNYIAAEKNYEYYVRYAVSSDSGRMYKRTEAVSITAPTSVAGELRLYSGSSELADTQVFVFNPENYTLTLEPAAGIFAGTSSSGTGTEFPVQLAVSNGKEVLLVPVATGKSSSTCTVDLRNVLTADYLDVPVSVSVLTAQIKSEPEDNYPFTVYRWALPVKVKIQKAQEDGSLSDIDSVTVPSSVASGSDADYNP